MGVSALESYVGSAVSRHRLNVGPSLQQGQMVQKKQGSALHFFCKVAAEALDVSVLIQQLLLFH